MVSRVWGTWFQEYGVHGFGGTGVQGTGYIVSHHPYHRYIHSVIHLRA